MDLVILDDGVGLACVDDSEDVGRCFTLLKDGLGTMVLIEVLRAAIQIDRN